MFGSVFSLFAMGLGQCVSYAVGMGEGFYGFQNGVPISSFADFDGGDAASSPLGSSGGGVGSFDLFSARKVDLVVVLLVFCLQMVWGLTVLHQRMQIFASKHWFCGVLRWGQKVVVGLSKLSTSLCSRRSKNHAQVADAKAKTGTGKDSQKAPGSATGSAKKEISSAKPRLTEFGTKVYAGFPQPQKGHTFVCSRAKGDFGVAHMRSGPGGMEGRLVENLKEF